MAKLIMHPPFVTSFGEEAYRGRPTSRIPPGRGIEGLLQAQRQSLSQNKNIKTPLLAAEAFPIQKDSDSGSRKPSVSAGLSKPILTGRGILPALVGAHS
ncbi:hypothetical protein H5V43_23325 (plasmid) [Sphingobium fuliginis]|uniref:Uncharacterized protein n=2 Tax=Sphingomonadaceae TaxID=41297 RepID=A0A7M2GQV5_SPHSA|nr:MULTISPECIES: hypothetical protein [Sphingobium]MDK4807881.1 hypothetical protein [Novosphingobium aromaticivorans]QOT74442.1 hypothetical protein H5V43_23325 [Sphingobium fuliginis]HIQ18044.1 hypothetical protein [Novosphingobium capsulatum]